MPDCEPSHPPPISGSLLCGNRSNQSHGHRDRGTPRVAAEGAASPWIARLIVQARPGNDNRANSRRINRLPPSVGLSVVYPFILRFGTFLDRSSILQPLVSVLRHKRIVVQVRVGRITRSISAAWPAVRRFVRVETPNPFEQSCRRNTSCNRRCSRGIRSRRRRTPRCYPSPPRRTATTLAGRRFDIPPATHRAFGPHGPVSEQTPTIRSVLPPMRNGSTDRQQCCRRCRCKAPVVAPESATARTTSKVW